MRKYLCRFLFIIFMCVNIMAHCHATESIEWYVDDALYTTTTCELGNNITPPTAPAKTGYTFKEWVGYTQIEYIESTGTQYIDTGVKPNGYTSIQIDGQFLNLSTVGWIFGVRNSDDYKFSLGHNYAIQQYIFGYYDYIGNNYTPTPTPDMQRHTFQLNAGACYIDNIKVYQYKQFGFQSKYNLYIFGINSNTNSTRIPARIYNCSIYDDRVLVRDMIPVLDASGVPCMYDKVENKFYYNAGTGNFIAGPIISE